jgi:small subunit ribosomal protein S18
VTRETTTSAPSSPAASRGPRPPFRGTRPGRPRYMPKRKVCFFCANKNEVIDYKNADRLRTYMSDRAKIEPRRRSGTCAKHQRALATAIKRARHLALLPYIPEHIYPGHAAIPTAAPVVSAPALTPPPIAAAAPPPAPATTSQGDR